MAKPRGRKKRQSEKPPVTPPAQASAPYAVDMTESARQVYVNMYRLAREAEQRGDYASSHGTTFSMVREAVKKIIPSDPLNKRYALADELSNIFRIHKGRLRICWIASSKHRRVLILFISETLRKAGDVNDPYRIFTRMVMTGQFDEMFNQMGVRIKGTPSGSSGKPH